ncbi:MAG: class I SAM-dependent methyltransferase [Planctomycetes bacterium]|nr:class I SAM-dependent methyltransferase [Planctomycetota bacterium]
MRLAIPRTRAVPGVPEVSAQLCCPNCRGDLSWSEDGGSCGHCGQRAALLGEGLYDFLGHGSPDARAILSWPDSFIHQLLSWLPALQKQGSLPPGALAELHAKEVLDSTSPLAVFGHHLSKLGDDLTYQVLENHWQGKDDQLHAFLGELGPEARVLDVGCGAGHPLRRLGNNGPAERVGLDIDLEGLAFGHRLAALEGQALQLVRGTIYALPFRDASFTHVICRGVLNYVHQRRALRELTRVLQPGGVLYLRVERAWYDLMRIGYAQSLREFVCRHRDLALGLVHTLTGWQPEPGGRFRGGRAVSRGGQVRRRLRQAGCEVFRVEPSSQTTRFLGVPTQTTLFVRKNF